MGKTTNKSAEIVINGVTYVPKGSQSTPAKSYNKMRYVICRTYSAGVFAGYLEYRKGQEAVMHKARRLWYWDGAASLSQLAMEGTKKPENCKFPCEVERVELTNVIEVIDATAEAQASINAVSIWKQ